MRKFFFYTTLSFIYLLFFASNIYALSCGDSGTENQCASSGGCQSGFRCTTDLATGTKSCTADNGCGKVCNASNAGKCGAEGGCGFSELCNVNLSGTYTCGYAASCDKNCNPSTSISECVIGGVAGKVIGSACTATNSKPGTCQDYKMTTAKNDCVCDSSITPPITPTPKVCSDACQYNQCSTGFTPVSGVCTGANLVCCRSNSALTPSPSQAPTNPYSTPNSNTGSNLGQVHGFVCGNTVCLPGEICVQYPGESQKHCSPSNVSTVPGFCDDYNFLFWKIQGWGNNGNFPANTTCINRISNTQTDLSLYQKSCIYEPIVNYGDTVKDKAFKTICGPAGDSGPGQSGDKCDIYVLAKTDVLQAEMGSYGPSEDVINKQSIDYISQNYLYNSLFDRPYDLTDIVTKNSKGAITNNVMDGTSDNKNKEAYRTYWRLMPAKNQADLRSYVMNAAKEKMILNINFEYKDITGKKAGTNFKDLYDALSKQVILFWHFPFFRVGCLTSYPVCPEYAQAQRELVPVEQKLREMAASLSGFINGDVLSLISDFISTVSSIFGSGENMRNAYDAFVPLEFDSVRGYIVLKGKPDGVPPGIVALALTQGPINTVSRENLPYIGAISLGLLSPKFGMIPALQPQWVVTKYSTPGATIISDYSTGNSTADFPEMVMHKVGMDMWVAEVIDGVARDPWGYFTSKIKGFFESIFTAKKTIVKKNYVLQSKEKSVNTKDLLLDQWVDMQSCPIPVSYHILSPKTKPVYDEGDGHNQIVLIKGNEINWQYTPTCEDIVCEIDPITKKNVCTPKCSQGKIVNGQCCTDKWSLSATKHGRALTVLNNPKQTDIQKAIKSDSQIALYDMLLPQGAKPVPEAKIDAPVAKNSYLGTYPLDRGGASVSNPDEPIMRESNLAQDTVHLLQNCWTIPKELQNSPKCNIKSTPPPIAEACDPNVTDKQVTAATQTIGQKYGIDPKWLEGMWKLEGGATQMGNNCNELGTYKVMGPMQIAAGTYRLVTCDNERFSNPIEEKNKGNTPPKLSRCCLNSSLELAARVILQKLNAYGSYPGSYTCNATKASVSLAQLFRAVNAYGACAIVPSTTKSYAQWVCEYAGNCPSPLPPVGAPTTCAGN